LFKWFLDLNIMDRAFDASTFSKNKERLLKHDVAKGFLGAVLAEAHRRRLLSENHFTVDGTLFGARASLKSSRPRDGDTDRSSGGGKNTSLDFRGERRTNATHESTTDPEAQLARKGAGKEAMNITPHLACWEWSNFDRHTTHHPGYQVSQRVRKRIEEIFGWIKTEGGGRKLRYIGVARNQLWAELTAVAYSLVRMVKLAMAAPPI
jgi:hypothetical protein